MDTKVEIERLREEIDRHNRLYYQQAAPEISDAEYDSLYRRLVDLESAHPEYYDANSPTQRVGGVLEEGFKSVPHSEPMLSLSNVYSLEELQDFDRRVREIIGGGYRYVCELKIDGVGTALRYDKGALILALTRGDGQMGDDITVNLRTIRGIPLKLRNNFPPAFEVRGEVYMNTADFRRLNERREIAGEKLFANPRNSTAGSLKLLDSREAARRPLRTFLYDLRGIDAPYFHSDRLRWLNEMGLPVNKEWRICNSIDEVWCYCEEWCGKRETLPYEIDGVVVKIDDYRQRSELGFTAKSPRWATAYKFPAQKAMTVLRGITLQVGRVGYITPVAELQPVYLAGSTIKRATLHNEEEIARKDIRVGDTVVIEKGGDVIPKVTAVDLSLRPAEAQPFTMPEKCPECGSGLVREEGEVMRRCPNVACPPQRLGRIVHFASRGGMDIEGMGESTVKLLLDANLATDYGDIYYLRKEQLVALERFAEKSADNLLSGIEASKNRPLEKLVYSLGIKLVGSGVARVLARHFKGIDRLSKGSVEELLSVEEIGPGIAESVYDFFRNDNNLKTIEKLRQAGVKMAAEEETAQVKSTLTGKTFVLTGTLPTLSREQASEMILKAGGKVSSSVSKKTDYVLAGENPGSKLDKARGLGVKVIDEGEFRKLIGDNDE